jgi:hypothetical protein
LTAFGGENCVGLTAERYSKNIVNNRCIQVGMMDAQVTRVKTLRAPLPTTEVTESMASPTLDVKLSIADPTVEVVAC